METGERLKPVSVARNDLLKELSETLNRSRLPACMKQDALTILQARLNDLVRMEYERDLAAYNEALQLDRERKLKQIEELGKIAAEKKTRADLEQDCIQDPAERS